MIPTNQQINIQAARALGWHQIDLQKEGTPQIHDFWTYPDSESVWAHEDENMLGVEFNWCENANILPVLWEKVLSKRHMLTYEANLADLVGSDDRFFLITA